MNPVDTEHIRCHLKAAYNLETEQIELMVASIRQSLNLEFEKIDEALTQNDVTILWKAAHSIKGALLNAGFNDWGGFARKIEVSAKNEEDADYEGLFKELKNGLSGIL